MVFPCMINELALSAAQVWSMVFPCMVNELALSAAKVRLMVFPCMVDLFGSVDSTGRVNGISMYG